MVPFPTSKMFHTRRLLVWLEALWGSSVEVEEGWHWRTILYEPPCAWCPQGQFTTSLPPRALEAPTQSGAEIVTCPMERKRHHALLTKTYRAVESPEDQSPTGQKSSFGKYHLLKGCGKVRGVAGWVGQPSETWATVTWAKARKWTADKATVTALVSMLGQTLGSGNWKTEGWRALWTTQDISQQKREHSETFVSYWPWMFCARQRPLEHG